MPRLPCIHHCTSEPYRFFGRSGELAMLNDGLAAGSASVVALVGPGGQGKTAIMQHWLGDIVAGRQPPDGIFLWSFYRGKDADLCLRHLYAYAEGLVGTPEVSASYCVDRLLPLLRRERWALIFDGTEVVQYESGEWLGRFIHPELGRLLQELAIEPMPGVAVITSRFALPELERRKHARVLGLSSLDAESARGLLRSLGVQGSDGELDAAAAFGGHHAKAVELLGAYLVRFESGLASRWAVIPEIITPGGNTETEAASDEEKKVARVLAAYQAALPRESQDILALATAFRDPPGEPRLQEYLASAPVHELLRGHWGRTYEPFSSRGSGWIAEQLNDLVTLRLLERVTGRGEAKVIDAHPLVRRSFEHVLGMAGRRQTSQARAGFLRGRPDRRRPDSLDEAREEVELFHAYCDAGLWQEADAALEALDNPRYRFVAPAFERDLLLRFFPDRDWRRPPLWHGFRRYRAMAICLELLGQFEDALPAYREGDAPLRGDALIALGQLDPILTNARAGHPWDILWQAYRSHALCLAGRVDEALVVAGTLVPTDVYEWTHVFECLLRTRRLDLLDMYSFLYRPPHATGNRWSDLARQRMRLDYLRITGPAPDAKEYLELIDAYDRGGLPWERALARLGFARWLLARKEVSQATQVAVVVQRLAQTHGMRIMEVDATEVLGGATSQLRDECGYRGAERP